MGFARDKYERTAVGATGFLQASTHNLTSEEFQSVLNEFEQLEADGLIEITYRHSESAHGYVDVVKFVRTV